jgi:ATP phosphoribosyltransferase regulatory subunit HisZ
MALFILLKNYYKYTKGHGGKMKNLTLNINPKEFNTVSEIIKNIRCTANLYGYTEFYPSSIEYYEERRRVSDKKLNSLVKLIAPTGDVMTLKNDPTLLVTKYACMRDIERTGYSKYFYMTNIFQWRIGDAEHSVESIQGGD